MATSARQIQLLTSEAAKLTAEAGSTVLSTAFRAALPTEAGAVKNAAGLWVMPLGAVPVDLFRSNIAPGVTDMTSAIAAAVAYCGHHDRALLWRDDVDYLCHLNIEGFWDVPHIGRGRILRDGERFRIAPSGNSQSIIHVAPDGLVTNDGLTTGHPTTIGAAIKRAEGLGLRACEGQWRIQMVAGHYTDDGVVFSKLPDFRRPLQIFGQVDEAWGEPLVTWDGTGASSYAALRGGLTSSECASANLHFANFKMANWSQYGLIYWYNGRILCQNVWAENIPYPFDWRGVRVDQTGGRISGAIHGIRPYYQCNANIGGIYEGEGIHFQDCTVGVSVSRDTIAYVEGNSFSGASDVNVAVSLGARMRTQRNAFGGFTTAAVQVDTGMWNQPKTPADADSYPADLTTAPAYKALGSAVIQGISVLPQRYMHARSGRTGGTNYFVVENQSGNQVLLSDGAYGGADFVPFRLPGFTLYSPTFELELGIEMTLEGGHGGGELALYAQGSAATLKLAKLIIPGQASFTRGNIEMLVINNTGVPSGSYEARWPVAGLHLNGDTPSLDDPAIRNNTADQLAYRLYWTPASNHKAYFSNMRTFVTP